MEVTILKFVLLLWTSIFVWLTITTPTIILAIFFLLCTYITSGLLLLTFDIDYVGLVLLAVPAGALIILFLFVILTLTVSTERVKLTHRFKNFPNSLVVVIFSLILGLFFYQLSSKFLNLDFNFLVMDNIHSIYNECLSLNISNISLSLFVTYPWTIVLVGVLLLIAMFGSIFLLIRK